MARDWQDRGMSGMSAGEAEQVRRRVLLQAGDNLRRYAEEDGTTVARCLQCDQGATVREPLTYIVDGVSCCSACGRRVLSNRRP